MKHRSKQLAWLGSVVGLRQSESRLHCLRERAAMRSPAPASCHAAKQLLLCSLLAAAANGLASDSVNETLLLQRQQNVFFYSFVSLFFFIFFFLRGGTLTEAFRAHPLLRLMT